MQPAFGLKRNDAIKKQIGREASERGLFEAVSALSDETIFSAVFIHDPAFLVIANQTRESLVLVRAFAAEFGSPAIDPHRGRTAQAGSRVQCAKVVRHETLSFTQEHTLSLNDRRFASADGNRGSVIPRALCQI